MIFHARKNFFGRMVLQVAWVEALAGYKWRDARPDDKLPDVFEAIALVELDDLRRRVALADKRAEAQRRSRSKRPNFNGQMIDEGDAA